MPTATRFLYLLMDFSVAVNPKPLSVVAVKCSHLQNAMAFEIVDLLVFRGEGTGMQGPL